jgi:hypothetical protein
MAGLLQAKRAIYHLDMEGFWPSDNCRIIAVSRDETDSLGSTGLAHHHAVQFGRQVKERYNRTTFSGRPIARLSYAD